MEKNTTITIRLNEEMKKKLEFVAITNLTTVSQVVRDIIENFFLMEEIKE